MVPDSVIYLTLGLVILDTVFWLRTTLSLRSWGERLEPVVDAFPALAARFGVRLESTDSFDPSNGVPQAPPEVREAKNGRPYVIKPDGSAQFITKAQAKALRAGRPALLARTAFAGRTIDGGPAVPPGAALGGGSTPQGPAGPDVGGGGDVGDFDYAGAAAHLTQLTGAPVSEDNVRAFIASHIGSGGAVGGGQPGPDGAPSEMQPQSQAFDQLLWGLINGTLDKDAGKQLAMEVVAGRQMEAAGPAGFANNAGGVVW